jgi:hypothetical protein
MMVDGASHHKVAIELALGQRPDMPHRQGRYRVAAKFMLRVFEDGILDRVPRTEDIQRLKAHMPEAMVRIMAQEGMSLTHLPYQDSYSYEIAEIFLGADSRQELLAEYRKALTYLPFHISPNREAA